MSKVWAKVQCKARAVGVLALLFVGQAAGCSYKKLGPDGGMSGMDVGTIQASVDGTADLALDAAEDGPADGSPVEGGAVDGVVGGVVLTIDRATQDFGMVVTATASADATFVIKNTGTAASAKLAVTLNAAAAALGFSIKSDQCSGMSLAAGGSCQVVVILTPASAGTPAADLTISAGPGTSVGAHLSATAIGAGALRISPDTQSFGMVVQSRGSASQTFTITNGGQQITGAASVVLGGTDKAEFQVTADGCTGQTLAVGNGSCQITVRFAPAGLGAKSASLTVSGNPGGTAVAQLSGTGITQGTVTITPDTHDFGSVQQMMPGASQVFTVKNSGQATTGLLMTTLAGGDSPNFSITANTCDGHMLAATATCAVTVQFTPVTPGPKLVSLSVVGAVGETGVAQLSGTALANASIAIAPMTKSFNQVTVNQSATAAFLVTNLGGVATALPTVTVAGATTSDAGQFAIPAGSNGCTAAIAAGDSCMVTVRFTPTTTGTKNGTLTVSAGTGAMSTATLTGTGIPPGKLGISPLNQDFGSLLQGAKSTTAVRFTVSNTGASPTGTLQVGIVGSTEFQITADTCSQKTLGVPGSCTVDVIFAPASAGPSGTLQIVATSPADSTSAGLTGTGLTAAKLTIAPTSASFTDTVVNQTNLQTASFTVRNTGGVAAGSGTGLTPVISGTNQADFALVPGMSTCTGALAPGAPCTVVVAFAPKTTGSSKTASLTINATPGGPVVASLGGNGITAASLALAPAANNAALFGNVVVGVPKIQTFVVSNLGQQPSTGLAITLAKTAGPDFSQLIGSAGDCVANAVVPGNSSCNLRMQFAPAGRGAQTATLSVSAAVGGAPAGLTLTATGQLAAGLSANPASVALGNVVVGVATPTSVTIVNGGDVATSVPMVNNGNLMELTVSGCGAALAASGTAGASCVLSLSFKAMTAGSRSATVTVAVAGSSVMFTISATGVIPCGAVAQPCCTGAGVAQCNQNLTCAAATSTCACGGAGQSCCGGAGGTCTAAGTVCGTGATCGAPTGNGVACQSNPQCASGNCTSAICCAAGQSGCSGSCFNLTNDNANCGACGKACAVGKETCTNGVCRGNDGQPCTSAAQCAAGICTMFFVDGDGDHYGAGGANTGFCSTAVPPGFATVGGDCCDSNVAVNPGVTALQTGAAPSCPGGTMVSTWDWNCSGAIEAALMNVVGCGDVPACAPIFGPYPDSSCGDPNVSPQTCVLVDRGMFGGLICQVVQNGPTFAQAVASGIGGPAALMCK